MSFSFVSLNTDSKINEKQVKGLSYKNWIGIIQKFELHLTAAVRRDAGEGFLKWRFASFMSD